jgi:hypothetical protein
MRLSIRAVLPILALAAAAFCGQAESDGAAVPQAQLSPDTVKEGDGRATPGGPEEGTRATVIDDQELRSVLGEDVYSSTGENLGHIVDILASRNGELKAAVIDFGGFLGVGSRKIAVDWSLLRFGGRQKQDHVTLEMTGDRVRVAPEYKPGEPVVILGAAPPESNSKQAE